MKNILFSFLLFVFIPISHAQPNRWQQHIKYAMDVNLDVTKNKLNGKQLITYTNNSPDTLYRVFFHLYWNAFQPNSSMDMRSRESGKTIYGKDAFGNTVADWDSRVKDRIEHLQSDEIGYCNVSSIMLNGKALETKQHETILEVILKQPILPKSTVTFSTIFESQVPKQIRRSGRDNAEGVRYSMSQWYPKIAEYDYEGWHADPYVAREFYGVWGDYDVSITLDKDYKIGATGILQNATAIGWGYDKEGTDLKPISTNTRTWKFSAQNVHDFVWAADPNYKHITRKTENGPLLHFIYKQNESTDAIWKATADTCAMIYPFMAKTFGPYPWKSYSFIQGGDGGMEYAMATLVKGPGLGTAIHEWCHSWYQQLLGTNESLHPWMDEGFTSYAEARITAWLRHKTDFAFTDSYKSYFQLVKSGKEEPMSTHSDHYNTNFAYNAAAYGKGAVFMEQLGYIIGAENRDKTLQEYYNQWKYKHPNPNDFIRIAEKLSNINLQWYKEYWVYTTKTIDYSIDSLWMENNSTNIRLKRIGKMPMPIDVLLTFKDSTKEWHHIPLNLMYGVKPAEDALPRKVYNEWKWTHPEYIITTNRKLTDIIRVEIDPSQRMADVDRKNNVLDLKW